METPTQIEVGRFRGALQYPPPRGVDSPFVRFWCAVLLYFVAGWCLAYAQQQPLARLTLIPPSPVTDKIMLDIRGAVENTGDRTRLFTVSLYLDQESPSARVRMQRVQIPARSSAGIFYRRSTQGWTGRHRVILVAASGQDRLRSEREVQ